MTSEFTIKECLTWRNGYARASCSQCGARHTLAFNVHQATEDLMKQRVVKLEAVRDTAIELLQWHETPAKGMKGGEVLEELDKRIEALKDSLAEAEER